MKLVTALVLIAIPLSAAPFPGGRQEPAALQELRLGLEQIGYQVHSHGVEIDIFQERLEKLESALKSCNQELKASKSDKTTEKRIKTLEQAHESLIDDIKTLKNHLNSSNATLAHCQSQLTKMEKQHAQDLLSLKGSLESMLALLQMKPKEAQLAAQNIYTVQSGDSLGQIALDHKTDIKTLKKLNNLTSDTIYVGQKIILSQ